MLLWALVSFTTVVYCAASFIVSRVKSFNSRDYQRTCHSLGYDPTELSHKQSKALEPILRLEGISRAVFGIRVPGDPSYEEDDLISDILFLEAEPGKELGAALYMSLSTQQTTAYEAHLVDNDLHLHELKDESFKDSFIVCKRPADDETAFIMYKFFKKFPRYDDEAYAARMKRRRLGKGAVDKELASLIGVDEEDVDGDKVELELTPSTKSIESPSSDSSNAFTEGSFASSSDLP